MILKLYFEEMLGYNDFLNQLRCNKDETIIFQKNSDRHTIFLYCKDIAKFDSTQIYKYFSYMNIEDVCVPLASEGIHITWKGENYFKYLVIITQVPCYLSRRGTGCESLLYVLSAVNVLTKKVKEPKIKDVKFNDPATIVFWEDGTKTVVKAQDGEKFDKEKGLAMAIIKKSQDNSSKYYEIFKKYIKD